MLMVLATVFLSQKPKKNHSHNGKNAFTFTAGLFRLVCSNGLVISDQEFGSMKIRHMGYDFEALQTTINEMVEKLPLTVECMNRLKSKVMTWDEKEKFALEAIGLRVDTKTNTVSVAELLEPTRKEREGLPWYKNPGLKGQTNRF